MKDKLKSYTLWGIALLSLLYTLSFGLNLSPYLRGPEDWRWAYAIPGHPWRHLLPIGVVGLYLVVIILNLTGSGKPVRFRPPLLLCAAIATPIIQAALLYPESPNILKPLFYRTVSAGASGVFTVGATIDQLGDYFRRYPDLMPSFPVHPQRYPPGLPVLFVAARRVLERTPALANSIGFALRRLQCHDFILMRLSNATIASAIVQMALPIVGELMVFPIYGLAKRTIGKRAALWTVALYPLVPSFALWSARWDQFYPLLTCAAWYAFWRGMTNCELRITNYENANKSAFDKHPSRFTFHVSRPHLWLFGSGLVLSAATFCSFGMVFMLAPIGLSALAWLWAHPEAWQWKKLLAQAAVFFAGLVLPWLIYQLAFGAGFLDIWRVSMSYHLGLKRHYWTWLFFHLYDFFAFLGLPLALCFGIGVAVAIRDFLRKREQAALPLGFALSLLLLNLSGTAQGEVARVWLFLTPFAVMVAVYGLERITPTTPGPNRKSQIANSKSRFMLHASRITHHVSRFTFPIIIILLSTQLLTFNAFLRVVTTGITEPPARDVAFTAPDIAHPLRVQFGESISLRGYDLTPAQPAPGDTLHLTLYWQAHQPMARPYTVFTHLEDAEGNIVAQQDAMPLQNAAPTTCWRGDEILTDKYTLVVPEGVSSGTYTLHIGWYWLETGERLPASGVTEIQDARVKLTEVSVQQR